VSVRARRNRREPSDITAPVSVRHLPLEAAAAAATGASFDVFWHEDAPVGAFKSFGGDGEHVGCATIDRASIAHQGERQPLSVSVVICTRDRPDQLASCLASFAGQTRRPDELLVVDNASCDARTRSVALAAGARYVREDRPGLDFARNTGARVSTGDIVAFTDDDTVLHPRWLERMAGAFEGPEIWAVTGQVLPAELATSAQCVFERAWGLGKGFERVDYDRAFYAATRGRGVPVWDIGAGANMAFRREVFERIGGFDERLGAGAAGCGDDSEYWYRILHAGGTCRYEPSVVVYHYHRRDMAGLSRQIRAYMRGHAAALLVQFERTGDLGNLRRLFLSLPRYFMRKAAARLAGRYDSQTCLLKEEVIGTAEGVIYYFSAPRGV
jgi:GT2 family glycosyltransferase